MTPQHKHMVEKNSLLQQRAVRAGSAFGVAIAGIAAVAPGAQAAELSAHAPADTQVQESLQSVNQFGRFSQWWVNQPGSWWDNYNNSNRWDSSGGYSDSWATVNGWNSWGSWDAPADYGWDDYGWDNDYQPTTYEPANFDPTDYDPSTNYPGDFTPAPSAPIAPETPSPVTPESPAPVAPVDSLTNFDFVRQHQGQPFQDIDCGPSVLLMALNHAGKSPAYYNPNNQAQSLIQMRAESVMNPSGYLNTNEIVPVLSRYGVYATSYEGQGAQDAVEQIKQGSKAIALGQTGIMGPEEGPAGYGHYVYISGYNPTNGMFTVANPLNPNGQTIEVSENTVRNFLYSNLQVNPTQNLIVIS